MLLRIITDLYTWPDLDLATGWDDEGILDLYFGGQMEAGYAMSGQVQGRIDAILPVRQILEDTWRDCQARLRELGARASD